MLTPTYNMATGLPVLGGTNGNVLVVANGVLSQVAPGAAGGYLRSDGSAWVRDTIQSGDAPSYALLTGATFTGDVGIGASPSYPLDIRRIGNSNIQASIFNISTQAGDIGGGLLLGGNYTTDQTAFALLFGLKNNSVSGDYGGYFSIHTRPNGGAFAERMRIDSVGNVSINGGVTEYMGATTTAMTEVGVANVQTSAAGIGNGADTTDDTLFTYSLPANAMSVAKKFVKVRAWIHFATTINTKRAKLWFAGTAIADSGAVTLSNADAYLEMDVVEIDDTHVSCVGVFAPSGTAPIPIVSPNVAVSSLVANASIIKLTGASTITGAANDVLGYAMVTLFGN